MITRKDLRVKRSIFSFFPTSGVQYREYARVNKKTGNIGFCRQWVNQKETARRFRERHRDRVNKWARDWARKHIVRYNNVSIRGLKRDYPTDGHCELCETLRHLGYHHYDDNDLMLGLWVCQKCHRLIEAYEQGWLRYLKRYLSLRQKILGEKNVDRICMQKM